VAGLGLDGMIYVLEDCSLSGGPETWAKAVIGAYERHMADRIVCESNFGGEMARYTIRTMNRAANVHMVRASKGKVIRAEPVSVLYQQPLEKVRHVGEFPEMEAELCNFSTAGYQGTRSPNRADALIWAITDLAVIGRARWATERKAQPRNIALMKR
jgi:phage terminase large subunit-like protein